MAPNIFGRNEPLSFSESCRPATMALAAKAKALVLPLITGTPDEFVFEDRVLVGLLPDIAHDVAAFDRGDGPGLVDMITPEALEDLGFHVARRTVSSALKTSVVLGFGSNSHAALGALLKTPTPPRHERGNKAKVLKRTGRKGVR